MNGSVSTTTPDAYITVRGRYCEECALEAFRDASAPSGLLAGRFEVCGPLIEHSIDQYVIPVKALTDSDRGDNGVVEGTFTVRNTVPRGC